MKVADVAGESSHTWGLAELRRVCVGGGGAGRMTGDRRTGRREIDDGR